MQASNEELQEYTGLSGRSINAALRQLQAHGLLEIKVPGGGRGHSNIFLLKTSEDEQVNNWLNVGEE